MKKLWCILLIVSLFAITGCSSVQNAPESAATDSATAAAEETEQNDTVQRTLRI